MIFFVCRVLQKWWTTHWNKKWKCKNEHLLSNRFWNHLCFCLLLRGNHCCQKVYWVQKRQKLGKEGCMIPNGSATWVLCENCQGWYHCLCVKVDSTIASEKTFIFVCKKCSTKANEISSVSVFANSHYYIVCQL